MTNRLDEAAKTLMQMAAILVMAAIVAMIAHKSYADISIIAAKHSGVDFWRELASYYLRNLAGGAKPGS